MNSKQSNPEPKQDQSHDRDARDKLIEAMRIALGENDPYPTKEELTKHRQRQFHDEQEREGKL
jgi:hypothetical protein